ncbi:hypothetical protein CALCODRAFT_5716 [Calocera cornea HHB12733]|uniref:LON-domain-containing protein n=1 Tax=Calocera cornea HHB12733 TaxID=1353952 RepID=A0A165KBU8_9BASI|nr:hypothetical protein CALCODRAFT_5716 [Calocera cornea HHB12733]
MPEQHKEPGEHGEDGRAPHPRPSRSPTPTPTPTPARSPPRTHPERRPPSPPADPLPGPSHSHEMALLNSLPSAHAFPDAPAGPTTPPQKGKARQRTPSPPKPRSLTTTTRKRSAEDVITPPRSGDEAAPAVYPPGASPPARRAVAASDLQPLLACPCCPPGSTLRAPTTLLCGHTVCSSHVTLNPGSPPPRQRPGQPNTIPTCPVPTCVRAPSRVRSLDPAPDAPSGSRVTFYPTPRMDAFLNGGPAGTVIRVPHPRPDTTVSNLMGVIDRTAVEEEAERAREGEGVVQGFDDEDGSSDGEPEQEPPAAAADLPSPRTTRPRKRPRRGTHLPPRAQDAAASTVSAQGDAEANMTRLEKELMGELLCSMCYLLLYEPVTTPCQHTFCAKCLQRSLDHGTSCPLCREEMPGFSYHQNHPNNKLILSLILTAFPEAYVERRLQLEQEGRNSRLDTPIFYPLLAFPGMPTMLHLFEPRYRLMLRRVMEDKTYRFGAIAQSRTHTEGMEYGTMMEIRSVQMFPDGRSMLETVGTWRFRIVERGYLDGYIVGKIERIDDYPDDVEMEIETCSLPVTPGRRSIRRGGSRSPRSPAGGTPTTENPTPTTISLADAAPLLAEASNPTVDELMVKCHAFVDTLRTGSAPWVVQRLDTTYGDAPTDPSAYSFWIAAIMPIDEAEKAKLLPIRSTRLRLRLIVHWIEQLSNNWWFSNGCVIA